MDFINSPQPCHWHRCPKYLFPPYFHWISTPYFHGISPDFQTIFTADPTNRDILKGCRPFPQSGDLLRWADNRDKNRNQPLEAQTLTLLPHPHRNKNTKNYLFVVLIRSLFLLFEINQHSIFCSAFKIY